MASITDAPDELRRLAEQVPDGIRLRMGAAELVARCREADRLNGEIAKAAVPELAQGYADRAALMLNALPAAEVAEQAARLREQATRVPSSDQSGAYLNAASMLEKVNPQPPEMRAGARIGDTPDVVKDQAADEPREVEFLAKAARSGRGPALKADVEKVVAAALAPHLAAQDARHDQIAAGIAELQRAHARPHN